MSSPIGRRLSFYKSIKFIFSNRKKKERFTSTRPPASARRGFWTVSEVLLLRIFNHGLASAYDNFLIYRSFVDRRNRFFRVEIRTFKKIRHTNVILYRTIALQQYRLRTQNVNLR